MILGSHFRLTLSVLSCFSLVAVHLSGAAPTTEPSITAEQYPRRRFQRLRIFFPASDSHTSIITILHVQPNDAEVHKAMPKRLYTRRITLFLHSSVLPIHVSQTPRLTEILCFQMLYFARAFLSYSCVFPIPAFIESSNSKEPLQIYFIFRYASKKTLCVMSCSCRAVIHPTWGAPSTEAFTAAEIPPADFLSLPQIIFPVAGSHANCITIIYWADEPEDYIVPAERSQSFVFAYVIHRLLLPATLSFNLEFSIAHGSHIEPATNSICLLSGSSGVFYVVHVGWATNNRWSIVYLFKLKL